MDIRAREELTQIIEEEGGSKWWDPQEFEAKIRSRLPTELRIVSVPPSPEGNFNCFVYALGLERDPEFLGGKNPIQQEFILYLLENNILTVIEKPTEGVLVFYKNEQGTITHGGIVQRDGTVLSKWMWGALFSHTLWDVPSSFGNETFFCPALSPDTAKKAYEEYKNTGVEIRPIS